MDLETKKFMEGQKAAVQRLLVLHKTAATPGAKRQITAMIKRYQKSIKRLEQSVA